MRGPVNLFPLRFERVSFAAGGVAVLREIDLTIEEGAPTLLVGPNGSGKTTLLRLGMGLIEPTAGALHWAASQDQVAKSRALVFQRPVMLRRSVAANLDYALAASGASRAARGKRVGELLDLIGLVDLAERPARKLSGGEQQRVALARALARDPKILFLDEPTASLDPAATKAVEDIVAAIAASGIKVVMASHDLGQARRLAGDVAFLVGGRLCERAPAGRFFHQPQTREAAAFLRGELVV